jgi:hypothetical protein
MKLAFLIHSKLKEEQLMKFMKTCLVAVAIITLVAPSAILAGTLDDVKAKGFHSGRCEWRSVSALETR